MNPDPAADEVVVTWPRTGIALVTLNRPERLNALNHSMVRSFVDTLNETSNDPACRVILITGAGRAFCAGMDIVARVDRESDGKPPIPQRFAGQELFATMPRTIRAVRQPVIAAVNGAAAGAGMAVTLAADIRVADTSASFHIAAVKLGLSAGECGISYHLPRLIGASRAYEYMLTGRPIRSAEAESMGLVSRVVTDGDAVGAALNVADEIAANSPFAIWQTKQVMRENVDHDFEVAIAVENRAQILALGTEDTEEAMQAFVQKRSPVFSGR